MTDRKPDSDAASDGPYYAEGLSYCPECGHSSSGWGVVLGDGVAEYAPVPGVLPTEEEAERWSRNMNAAYAAGAKAAAEGFAGERKQLNDAIAAMRAALDAKLGGES